MIIAILSKTWWKQKLGTENNINSREWIIQIVIIQFNFKIEFPSFFVIFILKKKITYRISFTINVIRHSK